MRVGLGFGQSKEEGRTAAHCALHVDRASVVQHDVLDDSQPQTGAPSLTRACFVDAVKPLEDARQVLPGYARSEIPHEELHGGGLLVGANDDLLSALSVPQSIAYQVGKDLVHGVRIG